MKKILFLFSVLLLHFAADAQTINYQGSPNSRAATLGMYGALKGFIAPPSDTVETNAPIGLIKTASNWKQYIFNGTRWLPLADNASNGGIDSSAVIALLNWNNISGKPTTFAPTAHNHSVANVNGLQDSLDSRAKTSALSNYVPASRTISINGTSLDLSSNRNWTIPSTDTSSLSSRINGKQATLVSGANIKTINGNSLLGAGDITISVGGALTDTTFLSTRIEARVKYTDTAAMLGNYARKALVADTAAAIRAAIPSVSGKLNISDTAAMLATYAKIQRLLDTALAIQSRLNLKLNTANPTATGTLTAPAITISGLTAGSANDSVVTVNSATGVLYRRAFPSSSGGLSGLTTNYLLRATSSTTVGSSIIQDNGTNLGINVAPNGTNKVHVNGGSLAITGGSRTDNPGTAGLIIGNNGSFGFLQTYGSTPLVLNASFAPVMTGVEATATSQFTSFSDGYTHSGGYSDVISAKSTNYPSITLRETGSGLNKGWFWGLVGDLCKFIPFVNPRSASVEMGYNGVSEGMELRSSADIQGISLFNTQSYKVWNIWNVGTSVIPSSAPQGAYAVYGGDVGYAHVITKEGRHILSSPASFDDGVSKLQVNGISKATQFRLADLNTAPSSSTDTGVKGEIRVTAGYIYICTATNTWVRTTLSTF